MTTHSVYSASSSSRWIMGACPASIPMSKGRENTTNPAAELGTAAHELGEFCLRLGLNAHDCLGMTFNKHVVDAAMVEAVQLYISHIRDLCIKYNVKPMLEKRVVMTSVRNDVFGTSDCIVIIGGWLFVIDYKHGYGVVEVENNPQAIFYAVATLDTFQLWETITHIVTTIVQPRADHVKGAIRTCQYTYADMIKWQNIFKQSVEIAESNPSPVAGEWCKYCLARGNCRARLMRTIEFAYLDKPMDTLTTEELVAMYKEISSIKSQLEAIEKLTLDIARSGKQIEGYKLVNAISRASCKDEKGFIDAVVDDVSREQPNVPIEQIRSDLSEKLFNQKLKGMTDVKKVLKDKHKIVNEYYVKPPQSTTLVKLTDKRPAISVGSAVGVFTPIE